ncbi:HYD1 signature containing ADP-ribosyltransferase family protein [Clostridium frigidicarnis]|uniref:HYD1 signature containing ADP-ribosyltransferase n=1 Tax=Clostridium frigidicarnis TaxID=84698 RepID=A0A1I1AKX9_9CLOT|nr:HYD1 signature containing ADP-ribosyltransferase family protein [Clostridium frigidicarnis]SFB38152.1 HYD1 signature containing ADP-ribosyltransferase [Clostridium frigidicarnis]
MATTASTFGTASFAMFAESQTSASAAGVGRVPIKSFGSSKNTQSINQTETQKSFNATLASRNVKGAAEAAEETTRVRHYTNRKGINGIEQDGKIIARDNNRVYVEPANKKPLSQIEAETKYQIKKGKGRDYMEFDVPNSKLEWLKNPRYGTEELTIKGGVEELINPLFKRRK